MGPDPLDLKQITHHNKPKLLIKPKRRLPCIAPDLSPIYSPSPVACSLHKFPPVPIAPYRRHRSHPPDPPPIRFPFSSHVVHRQDRNNAFPFTLFHNNPQMDRLPIVIPRIHKLRSFLMRPQHRTPNLPCLLCSNINNR